MKPKSFFIAAFIAGCAFSSGQANLVRNPNFDEGRDAVSARLVAGDTLGPWVVDRGSIDIVARSWTPAHHLLWAGVHGPLSIDLGGSLPCPQRNGAIHQDLVTVPGRVYQLKFALAGNLYGAPAIKTLVVKWGDSFAKTFSFDTTGRSPDDMGWIYCTVNLCATSPITRLTFDNPDNTSYGPVIDDISVDLLADGGKTGRPAIRAQDKELSLSWLSAENERYQIQWTGSLENPQWENLGAPLQGNGGSLSVQEPLTDMNRFYRIIALQ